MKQPSIALHEPAHSILSYPIPAAFTDELTKEKIRKHLSDINDEITEEDIRNIDTSITIKDSKAVKSYRF